MDTSPSSLQWELRRTMQLMRPFSMIGQRKLRTGGDHDGGYVMVDDFEALHAAYSLGVGHSVTWDAEIADRGITVHQYDHTLEQPPASHPGFRFNRLAIGAEDAPGISTSIAGALSANGDSQRRDLILKVDIEGAEWEALDATPTAVFDQFRQIVVEFHWLFRLVEPQYREVAHRVLTRLAQTHLPVHVHANNCAEYRVIENVAMPEVVELCYVRRDRGAFVPSTEFFPTALDQPNYWVRPEIILGSFCFM